MDRLVLISGGMALFDRCVLVIVIRIFYGLSFRGFFGGLIIESVCYYHHLVVAMAVIYESYLLSPKVERISSHHFY
jgi:hypothetical protein